MAKDRGQPSTGDGRTGGRKPKPSEIVNNLPAGAKRGAAKVPTTRDSRLRTGGWVAALFQGRHRRSGD